MTKEKFFEKLGWIGMITSVLMYVFYIAQIQNNLSGQKARSFSLSWQPSTVHFGCAMVSLKRSAICLLP